MSYRERQRCCHRKNRSLLREDGVGTVRSKDESEGVVSTHNQGVVLERCLVSHFILSILGNSQSLDSKGTCRWVQSDQSCIRWTVVNASQRDLGVVPESAVRKPVVVAIQLAHGVLNFSKLICYCCSAHDMDLLSNNRVEKCGDGARSCQRDSEHFEERSDFGVCGRIQEITSKFDLMRAQVTF